MKKGKLYGVSVGPGDPELMTLKAASILQRCDVIAAPRTVGGRALALEIAAGAVDLSGKQIEYLDFLMTRDPAALDARHAALATGLAAYLDAGRDVAMLNLGDASLYGSWNYLCRRLLAQGYAVETVPGVTSFCACAAVLNRSLTEMGSPLHIFPAAVPNLAETLGLPGGKVLMKPARDISETAHAIHAQGLSEKAAAVCDCGLPTQRVFTDLNQLPEEPGYFTTILIAP